MSITDKFIKGTRRFSTTIGAGGIANDTATTVPLSVIPAVFQDGDPIEFIVDRVSTTGELTTDFEETILGLVSGTNAITCDRGVEGTAQSHLAGAVVEIKLTSDMWNRLIDGILAEHTQAGQHMINKVQGISYAADGGSTDAYAITLDPEPTSYFAGMRIAFKANTANTGDATLNVNSLGDKTIKKLHDQTLATGDIEVGQIVFVIYDGTDFQLINGTNPDLYAAPTMLTDGATISLDHLLNTMFYVTLGGNRTLELTNVVAGKPILLDLIQDSTGSRLLTWPSAASDTVSITIATPGVITTAKDLPTCTPVVFTTTGALPTGITAGTRYYWVRQSATTGNIATSIANAQAGTVVATSGSQSGVHTMKPQIRWGSNDVIPTLSTGKYRKDTFGIIPVDVTNGVFNGYTVDQNL